MQETEKTMSGILYENEDAPLQNRHTVIQKCVTQNCIIRIFAIFAAETI